VKERAPRDNIGCFSLSTYRIRSNLRNVKPTPTYLPKKGKFGLLSITLCSRNKSYNAFIDHRHELCKRKGIIEVFLPPLTFGKNSGTTPVLLMCSQRPHAQPGDVVIICKKFFRWIYTYSRGYVAYTVTRPVITSMLNVMPAGTCCPSRTVP